MSKLEDYFTHYCSVLKLNFVPEYKFHPTRRWRFDFADADKKIAVECEGGIFSNGRHTRGIGYLNDTEKYNQAQILGWKVLRYCTKKQLDEQFISDYEQITNETRHEQ